MDTDSLYQALSEENLEDVILTKKQPAWDQLRSKDCTDNFTAIATDNFSPELALMSTRNMIRENGVSSKKGLDVQKCCVSVAKHIVVMINRLTSTNSMARDSKKNSRRLWRWSHVKVSQSVTRGSQRYFNQYKILNEST